MSTANPLEDEPNCVFVVARALSRSGKVKVSRKERLQLALVELRDRIHQEFVKVARSWRVSAGDLKSGYSYDGSSGSGCPSEEPYETVRGK